MQPVHAMAVLADRVSLGVLTKIFVKQNCVSKPIQNLKDSFRRKPSKKLTMPVQHFEAQHNENFEGVTVHYRNLPTITEYGNRLPGIHQHQNA
jgi:hypothetical protein